MGLEQESLASRYISNAQVHNLLELYLGWNTVCPEEGLVFISLLQ
jgi:hypothetical protein